MALWDLNGNLVSVVGMAVPNSQHNLAGPIHVRHLLANIGHDESETWCGEWTSTEDSKNPEEVSCAACLDAAIWYGHRVLARRAHLSHPFRWPSP